MRLTAGNAFAGERRWLDLDVRIPPDYRHLTRLEAGELLRAVESGATAARRLADGAVDALEQRELEQLVRCGAAAKTTLLEACLRDVWWTARRYVSSSRPCRLDFDDLVQEGLIGILRAIEKYDVEANYPFEAFASMWIHVYVGRASDRHRVRRGERDQVPG
jgi:RNA polymerase primary sigma factor